MPQIQIASTTIEHPLNLHRVTHADRLASIERPSLTPPPAAVAKLREKADAEKQAADAAVLRAAEAEKQAEERGQQIIAATLAVTNLETRLGALEKPKYLEQVEAFRNNLKRSLESIDLNGFYQSMQIINAAADFEALRNETIADLKAELSTSRKRLTDLQTVK